MLEEEPAEESSVAQAEARQESSFATETGDLAAFVTIDVVQCGAPERSGAGPVLKAVVENRSGQEARAMTAVQYTGVDGVVYDETSRYSLDVSVRSGDRKQVSVDGSSAVDYPDILLCRLRDISAESQ